MKTDTSLRVMVSASFLNIRESMSANKRKRHTARFDRDAVSALEVAADLAEERGGRLPIPGSPGETPWMKTTARTAETVRIP